MQQTFERHVYRVLLVLVATAITTGTIFYHLVEKFGWLDSYYYSVVTLTTVGYGDFTPHTKAGKIFTTFYVLVGIGIVTTFISYTMRRRGARYEERQKAKHKDQL